VSEAHPAIFTPQPPANPLKNPSYPQRVHIHERAHWQGVLKTSQDRVATARQELNALANSPARATFERLFVQMLGACDQVAEAARRLPGETGDLYDEDHHRLEEAVAALDRVWKQWETQRA
jgi:hypothetical protein